MVTLGIFAYGSDPAAAIVIDGTTCAFVEEERLIRLKHANNIFPIKAIEQVLKQTNLSWNQIDNIAIPWDCTKYDDGTMEQHYILINKKYNISHSNDLNYEQAKLAEFKSEKQRSNILRNLRRYFGDIEFPTIVFCNHHFSHACTAFFSSGFQNAMTIVIDGSGENVSISIWKGNKKHLNLVKEIYTPVSLGWYYSALTEYLGFSAYGDEWQVMGLSSLGAKSEAYYAAREKLTQALFYNGAGDIDANPHLISLGQKSFSTYCSDSFAELLGKPARLHNETITQWHKDIACAGQDHLEEIVINLIAYYSAQLDTPNLCLAGGVTMNVKMNGKIFESDLVNLMYVYPIASDCGTAIGAALALQYQLNISLENKTTKHLYLGNFYSDQEIEDILIKCKLPYTKPSNLAELVAKKIGQNRIVGWFQNSMEGGQRALGARSILANATHIESREKVNEVIKHRQSWRPFGPSMLEEAALTYFKEPEKIQSNLPHHTFDFMVINLMANNKALTEIPAVIHADGTSRIQIVAPGTNNRYHDLLVAIQHNTGHGIVLNTSFNVSGEPIVCSPLDAIRTFYGTGMDYLAMGNCLLSKISNKPTSLPT